MLIVRVVGQPDEVGVQLLGPAGARPGSGEGGTGGTGGRGSDNLAGRSAGVTMHTGNLLMDISIDSTVYFRLAEDPEGLAKTLITKVIEERCRLVVSTTLLNESFSDSKHERAVERARLFCRMAQTLGSRLVVAGGDGDVIKAERAAVLSCTPALPAKDREELLRHLESPKLRQYLPTVASDFRASLKRDLTYAADRKARAAGATRLSGFETKDLDTILDLRNGQFFWESTFVEQTTDHGRLRQTVREEPLLHRATITLAAYTFLNAIGSLFGDFPYGKWAGILTAPRPGDWIDATIATCAAYSRVFLTEDEGQRKRSACPRKTFPPPQAHGRGRRPIVSPLRSSSSVQLVFAVRLTCRPRLVARSRRRTTSRHRTLSS